MLLFAVPADRAPRSDAILRGVAGAGILLFYPEIAIFAVCGAALSFGLSVYRRRMPAGKALESLAVTLGVAVLINPVTAYYAVHSLLLHSQSKSGFNVVLTPEKLLRSIVGYQDPIVSSGVINSATSAPGFSCSPIPALSAKPVCCQAPAAVKSPELWIDGRIVLRRQGPNAERAGVPDRRMNTVTAGIE